MAVPRRWIKNGGAPGGANEKGKRNLLARQNRNIFRTARVSLRIRPGPGPGRTGRRARPHLVKVRLLDVGEDAEGPTARLTLAEAASRLSNPSVSPAAGREALAVTE